MPASSNAAAPPQGVSSGATIARLSAMMFLEYWPLGLWAVTYGTFLSANTGAQGEGIFSPGFIGYSATAGAIGGLLAPVLVGWIADRFFAAERVLCVMHVAAAAATWWMHEASSQTAFYAAMLAYYQVFIPTVALTNAIALRALANPDREFPVVRVFGTVAWISAGVFIGIVCLWWWGESIEATRNPFWIAGLSHVAMAAYSLTLPHTPPSHREEGPDPTVKVRLHHNRPFVLFLLISLVACVSSQAYNFSNLFLNERGYVGAAATLTLGQLTELACFVLMPTLLIRFGLKTLLMVGLVGWALRYALLAFGSAGGPDSAAALFVLTAIVIHGPCYAFLYIAGQMYVDKLVDPSARGTAQGWHTAATGGFGHLAGALMMGWAQARYLTPEGVTPPPYDWMRFWLVPIGISLVAAILFAVFFTEQGRPPRAQRQRD